MTLLKTSSEATLLQNKLMTEKGLGCSYWALQLLTEGKIGPNSSRNMALCASYVTSWVVANIPRSSCGGGSVLDWQWLQPMIGLSDKKTNL